MKKFMPSFRIGNGYDIHRLTEGRDLIIGGVKLTHPNRLGLDGHSDADVLAHSIMDAILGALSLGDIGKYFPPSDQEWRDANSLLLLSKVVKLIKEKGWAIISDLYSSLGGENISKATNLEKNSVSVKATTNETLGPEGREEGISCHSVVLLMKTD